MTPPPPTTTITTVPAAQANTTDHRNRLAVACVYEAATTRLDPVGYQRYLKVLKQANLASWVVHVGAWNEAPAALRAELDAERSGGGGSGPPKL